MRVLHVTQPTVAGVAVCVRLLARSQRDDGWRVAVACPDDGQLPDWLGLDGVPHLTWHAGRAPGPSLPVEVRALRRLVAAWEPDVVYLHSSKAGLAGRLAVRGRRPTVFHPNGWSFHPPGPLRPFARRWERVAARWTDLLVAASEREAFEGRAAGVRSDVLVAPNGVDPTRFHPLEPAIRRRRRAQLGFGEEPVVVCVGRLCEQKGQDLLLRSWNTVAAEVPGATLVLVGEGPLRAQLEHWADPSVQFVGFQEDVRPWLAVADLVVAPSRWEGLSFAVLEAMAMACPVVAFDVEGMTEAIGDEAGAVVDAGAVDALAEALLLRMRDPARRVAEGRAGRSRVEHRFDQRRLTALVSRELRARWGHDGGAGYDEEIDRAG